MQSLCEHALRRGRALTGPAARLGAGQLLVEQPRWPAPDQDRLQWREVSNELGLARAGERVSAGDLDRAGERRAQAWVALQLAEVLRAAEEPWKQALGADYEHQRERCGAAKLHNTARLPALRAELERWLADGAPAEALAGHLERTLAR